MGRVCVGGGRKEGKRACVRGEDVCQGGMCVRGV